MAQVGMYNLEVKQWLRRRYHVLAPDDWLEACVDWFIQEECQVY